jgi:uncharacterized membrane protein
MTAPALHDSRVAAAPTGVAAHRVIFIDLARAVAVFLMIQGHTVSALLAPEYRAGRLFDAWVFQRGLTSCLFLLLSGFAFSIATSRHWPSHVRPSRTVAKRLTRFSFFVLLGYALHFPVARFAHLVYASDDSWRSFMAVDVLQLIGVTFFVVQALVLVSRTRHAFAVVAFVLCPIVVFATPHIWSVEWTRVLPLPLASYFSEQTGSQFPLFPWIAYVLLGAGLGQVYAHWGATHLADFATRVLLAGGAALLVGAAIFFQFTVWQSIPFQFMLRSGTVLVVLAAVAHLSRWIAHMPHWFGAVAQESLLIYFLHLCLIYGSVWNNGLRQVFGETLAPAATLPIALGLVTLMAVLAWQWNRCKHHRPATARWLSLGTAGALIYPLL